MKIAFILYSSNAEIRTMFSVLDSSLVPMEIRNKYECTYKFITHKPNTEPDEYAAKRVQESPGYAFVVLAEQYYSGLRQLGLPITELKIAAPEKIRGEFSRLTTFWTKRIWVVWNFLDNMKFRKALLLPRRNFVYEDASELWMLILKNYGEKAFDFGPKLEALLKILRACEERKTEGNYEDKYFVDDRGYYFSYGHEHHGPPQAEGLDHTTACLVNSLLRLGLPYEKDRHFNVSLDGNKSLRSHKFVNCHGEEYIAGNCNHLNMFPNDYIG